MTETPHVSQPAFRPDKDRDEDEQIVDDLADRLASTASQISMSLSASAVPRPREAGAALPASTRNLEQIAHPNGEAGQHLATVEHSVGAEFTCVGIRAVDRHRAPPWPEHPYLTGPGFEVVLNTFMNIIGPVVW